jgi:hypothetical protein
MMAFRSLLRPTEASIRQWTRDRAARRKATYDRAKRPLEHRPTPDEITESERRWDDSKHDIPADQD